MLVAVVAVLLLSSFHEVYSIRDKPGLEGIYFDLGMPVLRVRRGGES